MDNLTNNLTEPDYNNKSFQDTFLKDKNFNDLPHTPEDFKCYILRRNYIQEAENLRDLFYKDNTKATENS